MKEKTKLYWRIKALLFAGAISAASLRGCTYGPPPVPNDYNASIQKENFSIVEKFPYLSGVSTRQEKMFSARKSLAQPENRSGTPI